ncbi:helicase-associated domain-containing protein [Rhodococcus pseudokoreensis]|uniref:Helicase-associated domain-containing protein n=1 Tax=Rhodococcus pseudokoreensis TaxID=2811421 RepID=A0A974ZWP5_9NOCA|nr:helicase-associated domain-containing protein [Rhodococcus pseudokoreensis]QSE93130.1 helicase-associated domain-containing protein [Rhodococcus pseudokoreensis]
MNTGDTALPTGEHRIRVTEQEAMTNLHTVLQLCAAGELRCSEKTHRPSAATVAAVGSQLAHGDFYPDDPIASFAWPLIIQAGGLATIEGGRLRLTPKGRTALSRPAAEVISQLWRRWLTRAVIDEFSRIEQIKGQRARNVLTSARTRRQTVAAALAGCPPGEWIGMDSLFTTMRRKGMSPNVARSERALYAGTLGLLDLDYRHPSGARSDFHDIWGGDNLDALSRYDGLQAIRLTTLGCYTLGLTDTYQPPADNPPARVLKVLPNLDIVVTGTLSPADQLLLSAYAEHTADRVWTVSAASLLSAIDGGRHLEDLTTFLARRTDHELPGTLRTVVDDVTRRAGQLTDHGHARVIECTDSALAALITRDRALRTLCRPIGDRHLAVPLEHEPKFRRALHKLGYTLPGPNTP